MPQDERGLYWPWYGTRYLLSRTRYLLTKAERSVYRDLLDMIYEAGGGIAYDPEYLCYVTDATPEELSRVVEVSAFEKRSGKLYHPVADAVIAEMVDFRESGRRGGLKSGEARREKAIKSGGLEPSSEPSSEPPSNGSHSHRRDRNEPPSERTTKQKEGRKEGSSERARRAARSQTSTPQSHPPTSPASVRHPGTPAPVGRGPGAPPGDASADPDPHPRSTLPEGWDSMPWEEKRKHFVGLKPVEAAQPPTPKPRLTEGERREMLKAQARALHATATPEQLAELDARFAAQDAAQPPPEPQAAGGES